MMMSLSSQYELYASRANLAETSLRLRATAIRYFVELFGDLDIGQINYGHIEDFQSWLAQGRSATTVSIYLQNLKPVFSWMVKRGLLERNPFENLRIVRPQKFRGRPFEPEEIERMLIVSETRLKVVVLLGLLSLRRAEALNLTRPEVHFEKGYLLLTGKKDTPHTWRWDIKNHQEAIVPLPEQITLPTLTINVHKTLEALMSSLPAKQPYVCVKPETYEGYLELNKENKLTCQQRLDPWPNFARAFRSLQRRAAVSPVRRFHDLRTTFATTMVNKGLTIKETQLLMRHSSPTTTMKYYVAVDEVALLNKVNTLCSQCFAEPMN